MVYAFVIKNIQRKMVFVFLTTNALQILIIMEYNVFAMITITWMIIKTVNLEKFVLLTAKEKMGNVCVLLDIKRPNKAVQDALKVKFL